MEDATVDFCQLDERLVPLGGTDRVHPAGVPDDARGALARVSDFDETREAAAETRCAVGVDTEYLDGGQRRIREGHLADRPVAADAGAGQVSVAGAAAGASSEF